MEIKKSINIKLISIIVLIIIIITTVIISIKIKQNSPKYIENDTYLPGNSDVKNKVENIDELEKDRITEEVISKLNKKYGNNNFEVINMEKGSRSGLDYDVFINETYFNINIHLTNDDIDTNFIVDYLKNTDNLMQSLKDSYKQNILKELKSINDNINTVDYYLSDYNGILGNSGAEYMSLDTIYGKIPSQEDINSLVHDLHIYCKYSGNINNSDEAKKFIDTVKSDIKEIYNNICQNYPRIPQGIGATSVEISFGNGVILRIFPLSKSILTIQGSNTIEYNWSDIL